MKIVDQCIESFLQSKSRQNSRVEKAKIVEYYQNQMHCNYKKDEKVLKDIIKHNVKPTNNQEELDVIVYYKNLKTRDLIMKNNSCASQDKLSKSWAVYKFKCPNETASFQTPCTSAKLATPSKDDSNMEKKHNTSIQTQDDINRQKDNFINPLKLYSRSPHATNTSAPTPHQAPVQHRYNLRSGS